MDWAADESHVDDARLHAAAARGAHGLAEVLRQIITAYTGGTLRSTWKGLDQEVVFGIGRHFPLRDVALWCAPLGDDRDDDQHLYTCAGLLFGLDSKLERRIRYESNVYETSQRVADGISVVVSYRLMSLRYTFVNAWDPAIVLRATTVAIEQGTLPHAGIPLCRCVLTEATMCVGRGLDSELAMRAVHCISRSDWGAIELGHRSTIMRLLVGSTRGRDIRLVMRVFMAGSPDDTHLAQWKDAAHQVAVREPADACEELIKRLNSLVPQIPVGDLLVRICAVIAAITPEYHSRIDTALIALLERAGHSDSAEYFVRQARASMPARTLE